MKKTIMETKNTTTQSLTNKDLSKRITANIELIKNFVSDKGYQIKGNIECISRQPNTFGKIIGSIPELEKSLIKMSKNSKKKLTKSLRRNEKSVSMGSSNYLLHFICTRVLKTTDRVKVTYSDKELKIKAARKQYKTALEAVKLAYVEYITEKGDFYKK